MIGTALVQARRRAHERRPRPGRDDGLRSRASRSRTRGGRRGVPRLGGSGRVRPDARARGAWAGGPSTRRRSPARACPPAEYLTSSYYEIWLKGLERLLLSHGFLAPGELEPHGARAARAAEPRPGALRAADVSRMLRNRRAAQLDDPVPPKFERGDRVLARNAHPTGRTQLPLRPRPAGSDRPRPRGVHLRRLPRRRARAEAPARLQRPLRRPRPVGTRRVAT